MIDRNDLKIWSQTGKLSWKVGFNGFQKELGFAFADFIKHSTWNGGKLLCNCMENVGMMVLLLLHHIDIFDVCIMALHEIHLWELSITSSRTFTHTYQQSPAFKFKFKDENTHTCVCVCFENVMWSHSICSFILDSLAIFLMSYSDWILKWGLYSCGRGCCCCCDFWFRVGFLLLNKRSGWQSLFSFVILYYVSLSLFP